MREIPGASRYMATEDGQIWDTKLQRFKVQTLNGIPQYYYTTIDWDNGTRKLVRVHRLVALAYWPNPDNLPMVDHDDRNKLNNHKDNLKWATRHDNNQNSSANIIPGGMKQHVFKLFDDPLLAKRAYKRLWDRIRLKGLTPETAWQQVLPDHPFPAEK